MAQPPLKQGTIAIAVVVPPRGPAKRRPCVVYTPDALIAAATMVDVVAISTSCYPDNPDLIPLPWSEDGRAMTRLRKPCSIALGVTDTVAKTSLTTTWGSVPRNVLADLLDGLKKRGKI
ncbi:MAG TPA: type II toxin-antitoxin system PemK/MazF family toxin [Tepidisphaeraceae bacterium]|nr:type II toxin-antitoxin system PemK/MazF family toxin [Tepidisphaeraceae bacterium]